MTEPNEHGQRSLGERWIRLVLGLLVLWLFVFVLAPWMQKFGPVRRVHEFIRENDIDATALVYTDVEEFGDCEAHVRDALRY